jgi:DNA-binding FadR family transcriptional regulator
LDGASAVTPRTMPQVLSDDIRRQIIEGALNPGDPLPAEKDLMQQYGVSRPTLREALRVLAAESLIETRRGGNGGARVREPDPGVVIRQAGLLLQLSGGTIGDVYLVRRLVEPPAARLLAEHQDAAAIDALEGLIEAARAVGDDPDEWVLAAGAFHREIVELCGNVALALIGRMLSTLTLATYTVSVPLMAGDAAGAEAHWDRHMAAAGPRRVDAATPIRIAVSESMAGQHAHVRARTRHDRLPPT